MQAEDFLPRAPGDVQAAVVALVSRLAPVVPLAHQPDAARKIAVVIANRRGTMGANMFLRQSIIRGATATPDQVIDGMTAWVTVLFDLDNMQRDRRRALAVDVSIPDAAIDRLARARSRAPNGCILAVPHLGCLELFIAHLKDRGFNMGFVYTIGDHPTPVERWIHAGRSATGATPIAFGRRNTGAEIAQVLHDDGIVLMVVDVYPSARFTGIHVKSHEAEFRYPPGPARFARYGTLVLPGFASRRDARGLSMDILDPLDYRASLPAREASVDLTQRLAARIDRFTVERPEAYWLWHPIPNDPYQAIARRHRPDLLDAAAPTLAEDEAVAQAVEAISAASFFGERALAD